MNMRDQKKKEPELNFKDPDLWKRVSSDPVLRDRINTEPSFVHVPIAVVEIKYKPLFELLDNRGKYMKRLREIFPSDADDDNLTLQFGANQELAVRNEPKRTVSAVGVNRYLFARNYILPNTQWYFFDRAKEQLASVLELFPEDFAVDRIGIRLQQVNYIYNEGLFRAYRFNYVKKFTQQESLVNILDPEKKARMNCREAISAFKFDETVELDDRVVEYSARYHSGIVNTDTATETLNLKSMPLKSNIHCIYSDLDFFINRTVPVRTVLDMLDIASSRMELAHNKIYEACVNG